MKTVIFFLATSLVLLASGLGLGARSLWQDEIETAERARTITLTGLPEVIDPVTGEPSVNAAGREIENSNLHRYTPWVQFYAGAVGLALGSILQVSPDAALRFPFVVAHSVTSGLIALGSYSLLKLSPSFSLIMGLGAGLISGRIAHNRTARYHALLDLFFVLAALSLGHLYKNKFVNTKENKKWFWLLSLSFFFLPHTHTLGGVAAAFILLLVFIYRIPVSKRKYLIFYGVIPVFISLVAVMVLTRSWLQIAWAPQLSQPRFRLLFYREGTTLSLVLVACLSFLYYLKKIKKEAFFLVTLLNFTFLLSVFISIHPFAQFRYFLFTTLFFFVVFWWLEDVRKIPLEKFLIFGLICFFLNELNYKHRNPFQGILLNINDFKWSLNANHVQPFHKINSLLRNEAKEKGILWEYVPQFVNWYLPDSRIALMPDKTQKTKLNQFHPIWNRPLVEPEFHVFYTNFRGNWTCGVHCDFLAELNGNNNFVEGGKYKLKLQSEALNWTMCIRMVIETDYWNNAPFMLLEKTAFLPEGAHRGLLILGQKCSKSEKGIVD